MFSIQKILIIKLVLGAFAFTAFANPTLLVAEQKWSTFTSDSDHFKVDLPTKPEHVSQKINIPKTDLTISYNTYVSEPSDSVVYVTSVWRYPSEIDMTTPEANLKDGFSGMLQALPGSEVICQEIGETEGFKSLEFLVKNEDIYFQGKLILVYNTLYQVFTVYKDSEEKKMEIDYSHFIDSFKLLSPEKNKVSTASSKYSV